MLKTNSCITSYQQVVFSLAGAVLPLLMIFAHSVSAAPGYVPRTPEALGKLVAPVALYPDPLLAQVLQASVYPEQVQEAALAVEANSAPLAGGDWQASVIALSHYPQVIKMMGEKDAWTSELGQAWKNQQKDLLDAVQRMRAKARSKGNLVSTPQQQVLTGNNQISIVPASPEVIYVPSYDPAVIYTEPAPPAAPWLTFGAGLAMGSWMSSAVEWNNYTVATYPAGWGSYYYGAAGPGHAAAWYAGPNAQAARYGQTYAGPGGGEAARWGGEYSTSAGGSGEDRGWAAEKGAYGAGAFSRSGTTAGGTSYDVQGAGARGPEQGRGEVSASATNPEGQTASRSWSGSREGGEFNSSFNQSGSLFAGHEPGESTAAFSQRGYQSRFGGVRPAGGGGFERAGGGFGGFHGGFHGGRR